MSPARTMITCGAIGLSSKRTLGTFATLACPRQISLRVTRLRLGMFVQALLKEKTSSY